MKALKDRGMTADQLRDLSVDQLNAKLAEKKKESFNLRFQKATGQLENTAVMRDVSRDVGRIQTVLREKQAQASK